MDWLKRHHGTISCSDIAVTLINHNGIKVECHPQAHKAEPMVCSIQAISIEEVLVVCEYPDVISKELPRMPPDRDLEFIIDVSDHQHQGYCSIATGDSSMVSL